MVITRGLRQEVHWEFGHPTGRYDWDMMTGDMKKSGWWSLEHVYDFSIYWE